MIMFGMQDFEKVPEIQLLTCKLVQRIILAWDPDFTKVTAEEAARIKDAEDSRFIPEDEIDWDNLDRYFKED